MAGSRESLEGAPATFFFFCTNYHLAPPCITPTANLASKLPLPRQPQSNLPTPLTSYASLLASLHYPPQSISALNNIKWLQSSENAQHLLRWLNDAFEYGLEEVAVEEEERSLFDKALEYKLVRPIPPHPQEIRPTDLSVPADYRSPSDLAKIIKNNAPSRQVLQESASLKRQRHIHTSSQLTSKLKRIEQTRSRISAVESLLVEAESSVSEHSRFLNKTLSKTASTLHTAITSLENNSTALATRSILDTSTNYGELLNSLAVLNHPLQDTTFSQACEEAEMQELITVTTRLERAKARGEVEVATTMMALARETAEEEEEVTMSIEELEEELRKERELEEKVEKEFEKLSEKRVRERLEGETEVVKAEEILEGLDRAGKDLANFILFLDRELAVLSSTHNALSTTLTSTTNLEILSSTYLHLLTSLVSSSPLPSPSPTAPPPPPPPPPTVLAPLYESLQHLTPTIPLLSRTDITSALSSTKEVFEDRVVAEQERIAENETHQTSFRNNLFLHSSTQHLSPFHPSVEEGMTEGKEMERIVKKALGREEVARVERGKGERERVGRLRGLVEGR